MGVGLSTAQATQLRRLRGPNILITHRVTAFDVLRRQLANPLLLLLLVAAVLSTATGNIADGVIISTILALSTGLGFVNEYRSERHMAALHLRVQHTALVWRDGRLCELPASDIVPGDAVEVRLGSLVPADGDLIEASELEIDESMLTGESSAVEKRAGAPDAAGWDPVNKVLMGSIVHAGSGRFIVSRTGTTTEFGSIVRSLGEHHTLTRFQSGLADFSRLLSKVAAVLMSLTFVVNVVFHRPVLEAFLFCLSIAIGITPQLLPAVVSFSLSTGARHLAAKEVLVKRLVTIEDLGNIGILFTDKTGTITEGRITFDRAIDASGKTAESVLKLGLLCNEAVVSANGSAEGSTLDVATWRAPTATPTLLAGYDTIDVIAFDHSRRMTSVLVRDPMGATTMVTKGAPESILARCSALQPGAESILHALFAEGMRVIAVAMKPFDGPAISAADEAGLTLAGFLTFFDRPRADAGDAIRRLAQLGVSVKIVTGDNDTVARKVCADIGVEVSGVLTDADVGSMSDDELAKQIPTTTIFSRISPAQKARIIAVARGNGADVGFLGDGVNDAAALHAADVGISVDSAVDVAKEAADIVLLDKSLAVLADGIVEGRRIFNNTLKYVLMATSSNFGNMFSAAGASFFLSFLPMLPGQVLLNNLLYDVGQLAIPLDSVDPEDLRKPAGWDISFVRRFMVTFGPVSSLFDFATFWVMLSVLDAGNAEFRSGWFIESLATQTLVIFVIRTRRTPFFRSHPSVAMRVLPLAAALVGAVIPFSPVADGLGFAPLPPRFFAILVGMIVVYLCLVEAAKVWFYSQLGRPLAPALTDHQLTRRHIRRRAHRFVQHQGPGALASSAKSVPSSNDR